MNDERLSRHIRQENLGLRTENSQLRKQMDEMKSSLGSKDGEILRLLNQIASDMVKRADVDRMIASAVAEALKKSEARHAIQLKALAAKNDAMAAKNEAQIAELKKHDNGSNNRGGNGSFRKRSSDTEIYDTKEEALAALEAANKKVLC